MSLSPPGRGGGSGGQVVPAPEIPAAQRLAAKAQAWPRIGHTRGLERWLGAPYTSDGKGAGDLAASQAILSALPARHGPAAAGVLPALPASGRLRPAEPGTSEVEELNALQEELAPFGLVVLGFPCNQFGKQEPGENSEILPSLKYVRPGGGFVPNFQLFEKGDVNGEKEQKFYTFLKNSCPPTSELVGTSDRLFWEPMKVHDIRWNFEKFLVGPDGIPIMRWHHRTTVSNVKMDILLYMRHRQAAQEVKRK
uniref:Glutathione peroxidase n=1 Tax=Callithrix jacchus TaxID=9483 RepID=A0A8I3WQ62_CALJA